MKRFFALAAAAIAIAAVLFGIHYYRHRFVRDDGDIVRLLPPGDLNLIYADLGILRRADLLGVLANIKVATDKEYDAFIAQTGFDYTRDLDAVAVAIDPMQTFIIGRGRFRWDKLRQFVESHHGTCTTDACLVPATIPGRWVNFIMIQPDVLAVAIGARKTAADDLRPPGRRMQEEIPNAPVWAKLSRALLVKPVGLPIPVQIFAISMQSAESVMMSAQLQNIQIKGHFENAAAADTARQQLEIQTKTLSKAFTQGNDKPNRDSIATLLMSGTFQVVGTDVLGVWPMTPELLKALR